MKKVLTNEERQKLIKKSHINAVNKLNEELKAFAKETGEDEPLLYEDIWTTFTLSNLRVEDGYFKYKYDGKEEEINMIRHYENYNEDGSDHWEEEDGVDSIMDYVKFYRKCLRLSKKFWNTDTEKLENLITAINELKARVGIKATIRDYGIDETDFLNRLDDMVEQAFDDQCTGANPRYPLMSEIKQMYLNAYYGN